MNDAKKREYKKKYPYITPDLVDGHCNQCKNSDIFSFGKLGKQINGIATFKYACTGINKLALYRILLHSTTLDLIDIEMTIHNLFY